MSKPYKLKVKQVIMNYPKGYSCCTTHVIWVVETNKNTK